MAENNHSTDARLARLYAYVVDLAIRVLESLRDELKEAVRLHPDLLRPTQQATEWNAAARPPAENDYCCISVGLRTGVFPGPWSVLNPF